MRKNPLEGLAPEVFIALDKLNDVARISTDDIAAKIAIYPPSDQYRMLLEWLDGVEPEVSPSPRKLVVVVEAIEAVKKAWDHLIFTDMEGHTPATEKPLVEEVFALTGGELADRRWYYFEDAPETFVPRRHAFTYWYEDVPEYVARELHREFDHESGFRTVVTDHETPDHIIDEDGDAWAVVRRFANSGETECPLRQADDDDRADFDAKHETCPYCDREAGDDEGHGFIYIGDGWSEVVYRLEDEEDDADDD